MKKLITLLLAAVAPGLAISQAHAQEASGFVCVNGNQQRRVEVYREEGQTVPCEVHYYKDTEAPGPPQVLWRAQREEGYCETQVEAFVEQLAVWGWSCAPGTADDDDTEDLGVADDETAETEQES